MGSNVIQIDTKKTGRRIKKLCTEKGFTVRKIQDELGIGAFQSVYNWFAGKALPSLDNMYRLSKLLNVPMEKMIVFSYELNDIIVAVCYFIKNKSLFYKVFIAKQKRHILLFI